MSVKQFVELPLRAPLEFSPAVVSHLRTGNEHVVVTGGGGWIGRAALEMLANCFGPDVSERVHVFGRKSTEIILRDGRCIPSQPMEALGRLPKIPTLLFHFAFLTRNKVSDMSLKDYIEANRALTETVARTARRLEVTGLMIPSSGSVYRPNRSLNRDLDSNPYGALKLEDEARFELLASELGARLAVPRVFNLAGPYINKPGIYVLASILVDILRDGPIHLTATQPVFRSYAHVGDLLNLCMSALVDVAPDMAHLHFDTAGEQEIEIGILAARIAELMGRPEVPIHRPEWQHAEPNRYVGDGKAFRLASARYNLPLASLDFQILDTAEDLAKRI